MKLALCLLMIAVAILMIAYPVQAEGKEVDASKTGGLPLVEGWHWQYSLLAEDQDPTGKETATIKVGENENIEVKVKKISAVIKTVISKVEENENFIMVTFDYKQSSQQWSQKNYWLLNKNSGYLWNSEASFVNCFNSKADPPSNDPFLILPLKVGDGWGEDPEFKRDDHWYQWYVEEEETITVPAGTFKCLRLAYRCNPDHELIWFCPNVGIVKQEYVHHGSIANMFMELTSYGIEK